jgi:hypothetical protein
MKTSLATWFALIAISTAGVTFAAPRSQTTSAPAPVAATTVKATADRCTQMIVRVPGRKAPRTLKCAPTVCARSPPAPRPAPCDAGTAARSPG